jgi:uncharacterized protein
MFDVDQPLLVAGLLLGLSSSLHSFGMCSGIAASLHFAAGLDPNAAARLRFGCAIRWELPSSGRASSAPA